MMVPLGISIKQTFELHIPQTVLSELTFKKDSAYKEVNGLIEDSSIIVDEISAEKVLKSFAVVSLEQELQFLESMREKGRKRIENS